MIIDSLLRKAVSGKERRAHPRISGPQLVLHIDGKHLRTINWSLGGFLVAGIVDVMPGQRLEGEVSPPRQGHRGPFSAEVVRVATNGAVGARFLDIDSQSFLAMGTLKES